MLPKDYFKKYAGFAESTQQNFAVPASITLSQGALESGYGGSGLTVNANNHFGIKADKTWKGKTYGAATKEFIGGVWSNPTAFFRAYDSAQESFNDHAAFLKKFPRYANLFKLQPTDYIGWAKGLQSAGYATDPNYASKLITIIEKYNLTQYDIEAEQKKKLN